MTHRLLASIAHDLSGPTTGLMGLIELLESGADGPLSEAQKARLGRIRSLVESIADLTGRIRELAVLESGKADLRLTEVDLGALLEEAAESLGEQARAQAIELRVDVAEDLPRLHADPERLRHIVAFLIASAMRRAGGSVLEIRASSEGSGARVVLRETSRAIPAEVLPHGFVDEAAAPDRAPSSAADGLKMSLARSLIELHGGTLTAQDGRRGEIAGFTLPAKSPTHRSTRPRTPPSPRA